MIWFLVKVFREASHADDFVKGTLFANRLSYFKKIEDRDDRADEGAIMFQRDGLVVELAATDLGTGEVSRISFTGYELGSPLVMRPKWFDDISVFCMYAGHNGEFQSLSDGNIHEFKRQLDIPEYCEKLGSHAVGITNTREFLRRVKVAAEPRGYGVTSGLVRYYDSGVGSPTAREAIETIFTKRKEFEYQKEYRLAIDMGTTGCNPLTICAEVIGDIAARMDTGDINRHHSVRLKPV